MQHPTYLDTSVISYQDPVAEVRQVRRELSERFGDDINALCDFLAAREAQHPERLVNYPPKPPHIVAAKDSDPSKE